jgi:hypothetical protein
MAMPGQVGNNQPMYTDGYGHMIPLPGPALAAGGSATTAAVGTITVNATGAGTGGTVTFATGQTAVDMAGTFTVTAAGSPAAGTLATVTFNNPLPALPKAILANMYDTDGDQDDALGVTSITVNGFSLVTALALVAAETYNVSFIVVL